MFQEGLGGKKGRPDYEEVKGSTLLILAQKCTCLKGRHGLRKAEGSSRRRAAGETWQLDTKQEPSLDLNYRET